MDLGQPCDNVEDAPSWLTARHALALVAERIADEDKAKAAIVRRVCGGLIRTKANTFAGLIEIEPQTLQRIAGRDAEIPPAFWSTASDFSRFDWDTGDLLIEESPVLGLQFEMHDLEFELLSGVSTHSKRGGSQRYEYWEEAISACWAAIYADWHPKQQLEIKKWLLNWINIQKNQRPSDESVRTRAKRIFDDYSSTMRELDRKT